MPNEDRPPRWMWHLDHELEKHFEQLNERRAARSSGSDGEDAPMMTNALARR